MIRASVVLPDPGGPQKIIDGMRSLSIALRRNRPGPRISSRPTISSRERGRRRSASGASAAVFTGLSRISSSPKREPVIVKKKFEVRSSKFELLQSFAQQTEVEIAARNHDRDGTARFDLSREQRGQSERCSRLDH